MQGSRYIVFPTREAGIKAAAEVLEGSMYSGLSIGDVVERYEGYEATPYAEMPSYQQHVIAAEAARNGMTPQAFLNKQNSEILSNVQSISRDMGASSSTPFNQGNTQQVADLTSQLLIFENGTLNRGITPGVVLKSLST